MHDVRYGPAHRRLRAQLASRVRAGLAVCARCGEPIDPREPWDLGHAPGGGPRAYSGPEHARCNRATNRWATGLADLVRGGFESRRYINQTDQ